jgi:iron complex transport system ATP-binding protein
MAPEEDGVSSNGSPAALAVEDVRVEIDGRRILDCARFEVPQGSLVALVGPNGAGKSTLARAAAGIQRLQAGSVHCVGNDVTATRGRKLALLRAYLPQRPMVPDGIRVSEALRIGRSPHLRPLGRPSAGDRTAIRAAMERTGISDLAGRMLTTLSGGELQRVQIAIALAQEAPVLIADEPTSELDLGATVEVAHLLRALADDGFSVLLVVHDLSLASAVADSVVVISEGRSVAHGPPLEVLNSKLLAEVWQVDAELDRDSRGTALRVSWLDPVFPRERRRGPGRG